MTTPTQPGSLDGPGLRRAVTTLCITEIVSWGILYYAFAVLSSDIVDDTGWSQTAVTAAFSLSLVVSGLVGIVVGRRLDRFGPRRIMTAGSVLGVAAVVVIGTAPTYPVFVLGWLVAGVAMAGTLYPPAFAALTRWAGAERVGALTTLTLVAGLASTVFAPLAAGLQAITDWRTAYLWLAVLLAGVTIPLHWWGLDHAWEPATEPTHEDKALAREVRSVPFIALMATATISAFVVYAAVVNLVPMFVERGLTTTEAAIGLGIGGIGQVAGRLGYARFSRATTSVSRLAITIVAVSLTTTLAAVAPAEVAILFAVSAAMGVARGIFTLIQATAVSDRWGIARFGHLNGVLTAPVLIASALAPFAGAALADGLGGQQEAFVALAVLALVAVLPALATGTSLSKSAPPPAGAPRLRG
ncbi:MFS transporter [Aeromicrobium terrae]|uniref:MFS transporter n=1 Tax=Aeromicrobium terrae TaxID=2498846 RepID=A0A5C8NLP2_9ACTN|nr:MFS transporter [Aeromicrobium terrae]TXL62168.1 MFS transporter [Aeromicrobium terrae]